MINVREVLAEVNRPNSVFAIEYQKVNGDCGEKARCTLRRSNNDLTERKKMNRSGTLKLRNLDKGEDFEVYIDFLRKFNGTKVQHHQ